jgi:hypothetical protein
MTKEIKADTGVIRDNTDAIKQDTTLILEEIARLKAQLPDSDATVIPDILQPDARLVGYLNDLTSYAATVCWSGEDSDTEADISDGDTTPLGSPRFYSSPQARPSCTVPVSGGLMRDPLLSPTTNPTLPSSQRGSPPPYPTSSGASSVLGTQTPWRSPSEDSCTQRVTAKLEALAQAETAANLKDYRQPDSHDSESIDK